MTDRPISFSPLMVQSLLADRKTDTRRVLTKLRRFGEITQFGPSDTQGYDWHFRDKQMRWHDLRHSELLEHLPYKIDDRLYVREHWRTVPGIDDMAPRDMIPHLMPLHYVADGSSTNRLDKLAAMGGKFRQGMHMPRWATRITLIVTNVRVQRLQEISEEDSIAEGVEKVSYDGIDRAYIGMSGWKDYREHPHAAVPFIDAKNSYETLWDSINAGREDGSYAWAANPWVVAVSFSVIKSNIDKVAA